MSKQTVFVIGASGTIGAATVAALSERYVDKVEILAGVRNPDKADKLKSLSHVTVVQATMGDKENLTSILKGVDALYINTPGAANRTQLVQTTAEAAKTAGVKHLVVVSVVTARLRGTVLGKQFADIEDGITQLGVPFTFLRLPSFAENFWGSRATIVGQGAITAPINPDKSIAKVTAGDAGEAGAVILTDPTKHTGKIYNIISENTTYNHIVQMFSQALGKEIKFIRLTHEELEERLIAAGLQEWQVNGIVELSKLDIPEVSPSDYECITGKKATSLNEWITTNAPGFW